MSRHFGPVSSGVSTTFRQALANGPARLTLRGGVFLTMTGLLLAFGAISIASLGYIFLRDEALQALRGHHLRVERSYEDHLASLRRELEKVSSMRAVEQAALNARVRELATRQAKLESRALTLAALAASAGLVEPATKSTIVRPHSQGPAQQTTKQSGAQPSAPAAPRESALRFAAPPSAPSSDALDALDALGQIISRPTETPPAPEATAAPAPQRARPEGAPPLRGVRLQTAPTDDLPFKSGERGQAPAAKGWSDPAAMAVFASPTKGRDLGLIVAGLDRVDAMQVGLASKLGQRARSEAKRLETMALDLGIRTERLLNALPPEGATGGPFVDLKLDPEGSAFDREFLLHQRYVVRAERLRRALALAPLRRPVSPDAEQTSGFGSRIDPFLGRPAYHTGVDFREPTGAPVFATAPGKVAAAGANAGYGLMIELDHGNGITTRYAHLSALLVAEGQVVAPNQVIGRVGSTGRSTGPHLHYEVRIDDDPVDPSRFLRAGEQLASYQGRRD